MHLQTAKRRVVGFPGGWPRFRGHFEQTTQTIQLVSDIPWLNSLQDLADWENAAWTPYMTSISQLIAKNQITQGGPGQKLPIFYEY